MVKTIIVTGGAGFLGRHLCKRLLDEGHKVICVDNFFTGSRNNISEFEDNPNFSVMEHDIINPLVYEGSVDQIYNLACPASPVHYQRDPFNTVKTCFSGMINMLDLAKEKKARILQASTSEIYGDPLEHPQKESYKGNVNTLGIRACYDEGKRIAETLCMDYHRSFGVDVKIIRIFNTYGPYMMKDDGRVVSNFIVQALEGRNITVYGDGSQTRSFCFVSDLVDGMIRMMNSDGFTVPVNLGNPNEFTILEAAKLVISKIPGAKSQIVFKNLPKDDPVKRKPDISLAKEKLGWEPKVPFEKGLQMTIDYFKNY